MKKIIMTLSIAALAGLALAGCNTMAGIGKDLQGAGKAVEKSAEK
ncbi:MAG: entericidin A/B family lipoprotein [Candidatus Protistobacter heckmanni]|nr:entericidin A/B family lipoprotein [Candidatus Protistobacter heckmanni]MCS6765558.1 entericidin A/B family lipoprotein [Candidatus Protistobacter heckmanni]